MVGDVATKGLKRYAGGLNRRVLEVAAQFAVLFNSDNMLIAFGGDLTSFHFSSPVVGQQRAVHELNYIVQSYPVKLAIKGK